MLLLKWNWLRLARQRRSLQRLKWTCLLLLARQRRSLLQLKWMLLLARQRRSLLQLKNNSKNCSSNRQCNKKEVHISSFNNQPWLNIGGTHRSLIEQSQVKRQNFRFQYASAEWNKQRTRQVSFSRHNTSQSFVHYRACTLDESSKEEKDRDHHCIKFLEFLKHVVVTNISSEI